MKKKKGLRLIDLEIIAQKTVDYPKIMKESLGYRNNFIGKKYIFRKKMAEAIELVTEARKIVIEKVPLSKDLSIKLPNNIDNITFRAMMELQALLASPGTRTLTELMITMITIACFSENVEGKYTSSSEDFKDFTHKVATGDLYEMLGIYNWIDKSLKASAKTWEERFMSVQVEDKDFDLAGGSRMNQFNVINTIKTICSDFNVSYDEAWQMSYTLTQTNSYSKATYAHIHDQMRRIKEAKMKAERNQKKY